MKHMFDQKIIINTMVGVILAGVAIHVLGFVAHTLGLKKGYMKNDREWGNKEQMMDYQAEIEATLDTQ